MVKKIIQIADLHIPNDNKKRPYSLLLKKCLAEILEVVKDCKKEEVRIVICGDIFHNKIKISNEAMQMFHEFLNVINAFCRTIIFAGNHDMLENNTDRMDSLTPTFNIKNVYNNITYADKELDYKSGYIVDDNIIWVLYSMFDRFAQPNLDNLKEKYPDNRIIGLYHGDIVGATTDAGYMSENGIDTNKFKDCDCVMAGHIHKFQEIKKNGVPIVYAGSVIQQNLGENITNHGFVVWDVETMKYTHHIVPNEYRMIKFNISSYEDVGEDNEEIVNY